jgi:hypothetical protein
MVFYVGEDCLGLHILENGSVKLFCQAANGRELILNVLEAGGGVNSHKLCSNFWENPKYGSGDPDI